MRETIPRMQKIYTDMQANRRLQDFEFIRQFADTQMFCQFLEDLIENK